jgi:hypothetical protein
VSRVCFNKLNFRAVCVKGVRFMCEALVTAYMLYC